MAEPTRLELATSAVTGQRSNQLSYDSSCFIIPQIVKIRKVMDFYFLLHWCGYGESDADLILGKDA